MHDSPDELASWLAISLFFAALMRWLPRGKVPWVPVFTGAFIAAGLFEAGKYFLAMYLSNSLLASAYGPSSTLVVVLLWTFYSVQIFLLGAEITAYHLRALEQKENN